MFLLRHSKYRLKISVEQFSICENDLRIQIKSLDKLDEFHRTLREQDELQTKNLSTLQNRFIRLHQQYHQTQQSLEQITEQLKQSTHSRTVLSAMIIRRMNLCQLLYKKLNKTDRIIHQREQTISLMDKSIRTTKDELKRIRKETQRVYERNQNVHLQCLKSHFELIVERSKREQQNLAKRIVQPHSTNQNSNSFHENKHDLNKKYYLLKVRLMKMIFRGIVANFVFMKIQEEFHSNLEIYTSTTKRTQFEQLNLVRSHLNDLIQRLKAQCAENHMLIGILSNNCNR